MSTATNSRLYVVDALRGFAIVSIMLLHNIEHFDWYFFPTWFPTWLVEVDKAIWDSLFFAFGGKSYAIFAFLFGLTFFIQSDNQAKKGNDFRARFAWRLLLLLIFGIINSSFYQGDILMSYAIIGFSLLPVAHLKSRTVFIIALILMLQPYEWFNLINGYLHPQLKLNDPISWSYFAKMDYLSNGSFLDVVVGNLTNGKLAVFNWTWENGRVFQTSSLFMLGMLAGRNKLFVNSTMGIRFWNKTLVIALIVFSVMYFIKIKLADWILYESVRRPLETIVGSWTNLAQMFSMVSAFCLLYFKFSEIKFFNFLATFGKMSLTCYVMQSIMGAGIYYGYGLGLYAYTGALYSVLIGICLASLQWFFCRWWLVNHSQGPLEALWHKATWIKATSIKKQS